MTRLQAANIVMQYIHNRDREAGKHGTSSCAWLWRRIDDPAPGWVEKIADDVYRGKPITDYDARRLIRQARKIKENEMKTKSETGMETDHPELGLVRILAKEEAQIAKYMADEIARIIKPGMRLKVRRDRDIYPSERAIVTVERTVCGIIIGVEVNSGRRECVFPRDLLIDGEEIV